MRDPINDRDELRAIVRAQMLVRSPLEHYREMQTRQLRAEHLALFAGSKPGPEFNYAFVFGPIPPNELFAQAEAFFGGADSTSIAML